MTDVVAVEQGTGAGHEPPVLAAENLTMRFGGLTALSDVSLSVPPGQIVGLIGPNGAGKSTCLGVLSGSAYPDSGRVYFDSVDVTREPAHKRARRGIGRTFQQVELFAELTVRQHLIISWRRRFDHRRVWKDLFDGRGWRKPPSAETERVDYLARCHHVVVLDAGRLLAAGTPAEIRDNSTVRQAYLGDDIAGAGAQIDDK